MLELIEKLLGNWKTPDPGIAHARPRAQIRNGRAGASHEGDTIPPKSIFLPLSSVSGDDLISSINELDLALRTPASQYEISLLGPEGVLPEFAMTIYELIRRRPHRGLVTVRSLGSLLNADILVWLAGDRRSIRSNAWVRFEEPLPRRLRARRTRSCSADPTYDRVYERITERLPEELAGREIWPGELSEWALIEHGTP